MVEGSIPSLVDFWIPPVMVCWVLLVVCCLKLKQCSTVPDFYVLGLETSLVYTVPFPILTSEKGFLAFDFLNGQSLHTSQLPNFLFQTLV